MRDDGFWSWVWCQRADDSGCKGRVHVYPQGCTRGRLPMHIDNQSDWGPDAVFTLAHSWLANNVSIESRIIMMHQPPQHPTHSQPLTHPLTSLHIHTLAADIGALEQMKKESPDAQVKTKNQLGTINGVFVPCLLNILGAVLFMRIGYSVGYAGESCMWLGATAETPLATGD
jgi:hypothetical protein